MTNPSIVLRERIPAALMGLAGLLCLYQPLTTAADKPKSKKDIARRATDSGSGGAEHPLRNAIRIARRVEKTTRDLGDYSANFSKREVVKRKLVTQKMRIKVRHAPFSVYLRFVDPHEGREVIYHSKKNDGHLLAHETGLSSLIGTVQLLPTSERAMAENRYPITEIGMANLATRIIRQWEAETRYAETEVSYYPKARLGGRPCKVIESEHPVPRREFSFHRTRLYIDSETDLPIRLEQFGFPRSDGAEPLLIEQYTYTDIRTNLNMSDRDFDEENPGYDF